jgi:hypothetical protein
MNNDENEILLNEKYEKNNNNSEQIINLNFNKKENKIINEYNLPLILLNSNESNKNFNKNSNKNLIFNNNINKNYIKEIKTIEISSDAFPKQIKKNNNNNNLIKNLPKEKAMAKIHKILSEKGSEIGHELDMGMIYYKKIPIDLIREVKILYEEWFPLKYDDEYFIKYLNEVKDYFNIGGFITIKEKEYLIGNNNFLIFYF